MTHFNFGSVRAPNGNDEFTKALLHFDGDDGSTSIVDEALGTSVAHTWAAGVGSTLNASAKKFGKSGLVTTGANSGGVLLPCAAGDDIALTDKDWTVDFWLNFLGNSATVFLCGKGSTGAAVNNAFYIIRSINFLQCEIATGGSAITFNGTIPDNTTAHHWALQRVGNIGQIFCDGVKQTETAINAGAVNNDGGALAVGRLGSQTTLCAAAGFDEFRLTVGQARYSGNFTPETNPYS